MMDKLVKLVSEKTGLSEEMAKIAVDTVVGYLRENLLAPIAGQVDGVLGGAEVTDVGGMLRGLEGILGKA